MKLLLTAIFIFFVTALSAQMYITRTGTAEFFSKTPVEDIRAINNQVYAIIDLGKQQIAATLLMKGFEFKKELMQTHFNENYVESDKFPKAVFSGVFVLPGPMLVTGANKVTINGLLVIHGVKKNIAVPATLQFINGVLIGDAVFNISPADFDIKIPSLVRDNIARQVQVTIHMNCKLKD